MSSSSLFADASESWIFSVYVWAVPTELKTRDFRLSDLMMMRDIHLEREVPGRGLLNGTEVGLIFLTGGVG